jgi:YD repeat-containing protein
LKEVSKTKYKKNFMKANKSKLRIILSLFCVVNQSIIAQNNESILRIPSPQTYNFIKYGNIPISGFTGESNVKIPIYVFKDNDFELPIYLGYNSSGFIPNMRDGVVGLNWYLNAGGAIIREVKGVPDEKQAESSTSNNNPGGYYCAIKEGGLSSLTKDEILNLSFNDANLATTGYLYKGTNSYYELQPDKFTFSIPGFNGSFIIGNDGQAKCKGDKPFSVDLSQFTIQPFQSQDVVGTSQFIITTDEGYKYYFGGTSQYLEVNHVLSPQETGSSTGTYGLFITYYSTINAWHLQQIVCPNGNSVIFKYKDFNNEVLNGLPTDAIHYIFNKYVNYSATFDITYNPWNTVSTGSGAGNGYGAVYEATKTVYLTNILIDKKTDIQFDYDEKSNKFYSDEVSSCNQYNQVLTDIFIKYNGEIKKEIFLKYNNAKRLFLKSITEKGCNPYVLTYYDEDDQISIPDPTTYGVDHWGFWNGQSENTSLIPDFQFSTDYDETYTDTHRSPDANYCSIGLLKNIKYPTGGSTEFFYEGHNYAKRLESKSENSFLPKLYYISGVAGGARVSKVIDYDENNNKAGERDFEYKIPGTTISSGILLQWPRYYYFLYWKDNGIIYKGIRESSRSLWANHYPEEKYIQYSVVTEFIKPNGGEKITYFKNYETNPDIADFSTEVALTDLYNGIPSSERNYNTSYPGIQFNSMSDERGMPYLTLKYSNNNGTKTLVEKIEDDYYSITSSPNKYIAAVHLTGCLAQSFKIYYSPSSLKDEIVTQYSPDGADSTKISKSFVYNDNGQIIQEKVTDNGDVTTNFYKYPGDYSERCNNDYQNSASSAQNIYDDCLKTCTPVGDCIKLCIENGTSSANCDENYTNCTMGCESSYNSSLTTFETALQTCLNAETWDAEGIIKLKDKHILSPIIEELTTKESNSSTSVIAGKLTLYNDFGDGLIFPAEVLSIESTKPSTNLTKSEINSNNQLSYHSDYKPKIYYDNYDNYGNLIEYHNANNISTAILWGYNNVYPIAKVENASLSDIAFENFEEESVTGNWIFTSGTITSSYAKTGIYSCTGAILNITPSQKSVVSLWAKVIEATAPSINGYIPVNTYSTSDGWTYYEWIVYAGTNISVNGNSNFIDDLRMYPVCASMTTYTYKPLEGMSSQSDANSTATYYDYDSYGRLKSVRNNNRNLLKALEYKYANN